MNNRSWTIARLLMLAAAMFLLLTLFLIFVKATPQTKKLPEGQSCFNTFDTDAAHKCDCLTGMKCPMKKPEPCTDEEGNCPQPDNGPDSTKCISPYCKKDACKCANPCKS
jgi:hypothetical protein